jgi:hypothetical protein
VHSFLTRHASEVKGTLSGFDRVRFRGTLRRLANLKGMATWLSHSHVLLKHFRDYAMGLTDMIKRATAQLAERTERPLTYLYSSSLRKETLAREIAERDGVTEGLVCVLTAVEPCITFTVGPNREAKKLELRRHQGKCLHQYFYLIDPQLGWLNVRLQTWLPFTVQIVINGREWLSRQLLQKGIEFERRENCFVDVADLSAAQRLLDRQSRTNWSRLLDRILRRVHPSHRRLFGADRLHHYWSADETEWATDVLFRSPQALARLYPRLIREAITNFRGGDVLRFLGKRTHVQQLRTAELLSHLGTRVEGVRVKHALERNSIKMYDKQQSVLRVETTINQTRQMKVFRSPEDDPTRDKSWQKLRKGVADLHRRSEISQACNARYLEALASVDCEPTLGETAARLCRRTHWKGRSVRALNPLAAEDAALLAAIARGEFALQGFRNRDLSLLLFGAANDAHEKRRRMAKTTRLIRMLRAHGLVRKVSRTHRYVVSPTGRDTITVLLAARGANTRKLTELAA